MKRGRRVVTLIVALFLLVLVPHKVKADQYGGHKPTKEISIEKFVEVPGSSDFVNNLSADDSKFNAGDVVTFKLVVKNPSDATLHNVTVTDQVPDFLQPIEGP